MLATRVGLPDVWAESVVGFCCSDCKRARGGDQGQLYGVAFSDEPTGRWLWWPVGKHSMWIFPTASGGNVRVRTLHHGEWNTTRDSLDRLVSLEREVRIPMNCRVASHSPRPNLSTWIRSRAISALEDGYSIVHVAAS